MRDRRAIYFLVISLLLHGHLLVLAATQRLSSDLFLRAELIPVDVVSLAAPDPAEPATGLVRSARPTPALHPQPRRAAFAPPPQAARAAPVVTESPPPSLPTAEANTFLSGTAPIFPGGVTHLNGSGTLPEDDPMAREWGDPGGDGAGGGGFGADRRRSASLGGIKHWQCPFPPEANGTDHAQVQVGAFVDADGTATRIVVFQDPGLGFGREAAACAMKEHYIAARDRDGKPTRGRTHPFRVYFDRL